MTAAIGFLCSGAFGLLLLPILRALKAGQSLREIGPTWHNYKAGTPLMGGLMFIGAMLVCLILNYPISYVDHTPWYVFALAVCYGSVGFVDDFFKVRYKRDLGVTALQKSAMQMVVSAVFIYFMYRSGNMTMDITVPFTKICFNIPPALYILFAAFVMVGCVNAVNLTDGVDGLSGSVTIPVMVFFTAVCLGMERYDLSILPASMVGGLIAYLLFNWHPARVFMGDTGSLFMGGMVCGMAFALDIPLILLLVGFIYIVETISVILQVGYFKATHGKRLFKMAPIHHHFEMCGWNEVRIVLTFAGISWVMCLIAWFGVQNVL